MPYWSPAGLAAISGAESTQQNIPENVPNVPYCPLGNCGKSQSSASGYYQMVDGTYATGATNAGLTPVNDNIAMNDTPYNQALAAGNVPISNWTNFSANDAAVASNPANIQSTPLTQQQLDDYIAGGGSIPGLGSNNSAGGTSGSDLSFTSPSDFNEGAVTGNGDNYNYFGLNPVSTDPNTVSESTQVPNASDYNYFGLNPPIDEAGTVLSNAANAGGASSQWWQDLENYIGQGFLRAGVAILALILIAAAAWAFSKGDTNFTKLAAALKSTGNNARSRISNPAITAATI